MSFMEPQIDYFTAYEVETSSHSEIILADLVGDISQDDDWIDTVSQYLEGSVIDTDERPELISGYFYRLSAPGYLDCTEWSGPYATYEEAEESLQETYFDDIDD